MDPSPQKGIPPGRRGKRQNRGRTAKYMLLEDPVLGAVSGTPHRKASCVKIVGMCTMVILFIVLAVATGVGVVHPETYDFVFTQPPKPVCQFEAVRSASGTAMLRGWGAAECQKVFRCDAHTPFLINRTCTIEDESVGEAGPLARGVALVVSHKFRAVYVVNPTGVDQLVQYIWKTFLRGEDMDSHQLTLEHLNSYFFFTFVDRPRTRFSLQFTRETLAAGILNTSSSCEAVRAAANSAVVHGMVPSQAYFLSGDAGAMNHMLALDWVADASDVDNVLELLRHVQALTKKNRCVPEIDFIKVNYEFLRANLQIYDSVSVFRRCLNDSFWAAVDSYYRQDTVCWFA